MRTARWTRSAAIGVAIVALTFCALAVVTAGRTDAELERTAYGNLLALRVVANSDSPEDQALKRQVRDALLPAVHAVVAGARSRSEVEARMATHEADWLRIARGVIHEAGFTYDVRVVDDPAAFPVKRSDAVTLPAGTYHAVQVVIGAGAGHNWWCVLFPDLCFAGDDGGLKRAAGDQAGVMADGLNGSQSAPAAASGEPGATAGEVAGDEPAAPGAVTWRLAFVDHLSRIAVAQAQRVKELWVASEALAGDR